MTNDRGVGLTENAGYRLAPLRALMTSIFAGFGTPGGWTRDPPGAYAAFRPQMHCHPIFYSQQPCWPKNDPLAKRSNHERFYDTSSDGGASRHGVIECAFVAFWVARRARVSLLFIARAGGFHNETVSTTRPKPAEAMVFLADW